VPAIPAQLVDDTARRFRLLGDPTRLRLLDALHEAGELTLAELAGRTATSSANACKHLALLDGEGVVAKRRSGSNVHYRIVDPTMIDLCELVCAGLRERYASLARLSGNEAAA
jgi:DNA-binding transcriptional ArsR family regulator